MADVASLCGPMAGPTVDGGTWWLRRLPAGSSPDSVVLHAEGGQAVQLSRAALELGFVRLSDRLYVREGSCRTVFITRGGHGQHLGRHLLEQIATPGGLEGWEADHINRDTLDNRFENLRTCRRWQNQLNKRKRTGTKSRYKGLIWDAQRGKWRSRITLKGKKRWLGTFTREEDAARAYDRAAEQLHGEFKSTNSDLGLLPRAER